MNTLSPQGHNNPPSDAEIIRDRLSTNHAALLRRAADLSSGAERVPEACEDEATAGKIGDLIKQITATGKALEAARVAEKEPYLSQGRAVDGFFKVEGDRLEAARRRAKNPLDGYLRKKEAEERRVREEEAKRLRDASEAEARAAALLQSSNLRPEAEKMLDQAVVTAGAAQKAEKDAGVNAAELSRTRSTSGALASLRTTWVGEAVDFNAIDLEVLRHHLAPGAIQSAVNSYVRAGGRELKGAKIYEKTETVVR